MSEKIGVGLSWLEGLVEVEQHEALVAQLYKRREDMKAEHAAAVATLANDQSEEVAQMQRDNEAVRQSITHIATSCSARLSSIQFSTSVLFWRPSTFCELEGDSATHSVTVGLWFATGRGCSLGTNIKGTVRIGS